MKKRTSKSTASPHPWSKDAFFTKAQRYSEEMLNCERDEWKFSFWSSLTLEVLARAALSHIDTALLADPKDWNNLYYALGHTPKANRFSPKSIDITTVFSRLSELVPEFDVRLSGFGAKHMSLRNEELHSGSNPFDTIDHSDWIPKFYESAEILTTTIGESLESLLGITEAILARKMIAAAKDESAKAVAKSVEAHKSVWNLKSDDERKRLAGQAELWATRQEGHRVNCPSCNSKALVTGAPEAPPKQKLEDDVIIETQVYLPSRFECIACGLKIIGLPQLHACGLGSTYKAKFTYDAADYYAPHDPYDGYEPDNNEP